MMRQKQLNGLASWLPVLLTLLLGIADGTTTNDIQLQIRLRNSDGTAVTGETIILQQLPQEEAITPECETNTNGECTWYVGRGLYQLLFERPLDDISALALAEGGLRGFGITVGDENITYHFTFHSNGRVYFDAAPEAAVPSPIIPTGDVLHGGTSPTVTPSPPQPAGGVAVTVTPPAEQVAAEDTAVNNTSPNPWRFILFISGGLIIGGGLHLWSRQPTNVARRRFARKSKIVNRKSEPSHD